MSVPRYKANISEANIESMEKDTFKCEIKGGMWSALDFCFRPLFKLESKEQDANSLDCRFYDRYIPPEEHLAKEFMSTIKLEDLKRLIYEALK